MRLPRMVMMAVLVAVFATPMLIPGVAHATLNGPCEAQATVSGDGGGSYESIDPKAKTGVYTVPISGSANYSGSIDVEPPEDGRPISGSVQVALPAGGSITIKSWSDEDAEGTSDTGTVTWDLPDITPRGIEMNVSGSHSDLVSCSGAITVKLDGGLTDSPTGVVSLVLTLLTGLGMAFSALPKKP